MNYFVEHLDCQLEVLPSDLDWDVPVSLTSLLLGGQSLFPIDFAFDEVRDYLAAVRQLASV